MLDLYSILRIINGLLAILGLMDNVIKLVVKGKKGRY
jgi:hypothetical protein